MAVKEEKMMTVGQQNASGLMLPYGGVGGGQGMSPVKYGLYSPGLSNDPLLSGSTPRGKVREARSVDSIKFLVPFILHTVNICL